MKSQAATLLRAALFSSCLMPWAQGAKELKSGEFAFIKNQVEHSLEGKKTLAKENSPLEENSIVDTGGDSLTQLNFTDASVLRLGSNTQFSFQSKERIIKLDRGAMMMHVPAGNGGITVDGGGVTGAVSGTTVMASRDADGNFAFVVLETKGTARVQLTSGQSSILLPGQIALVRKAEGSIRVLDIHLDALMHSSFFFTSFPDPIPGLDDVLAVADNQAAEIKDGLKEIFAYADTGLRGVDPEKDPLALLFGKSREDMVASLNPFIGEPGTAAGEEEKGGGSGNSGIILGGEMGKGGEISDARQPGGDEVASSSNRGVGDGLGDTDTAAGGDLADTDTAAGGGGGADTQAPTAPAPVSGGVTANQPQATPGAFNTISGS